MRRTHARAYGAAWRVLRVPSLAALHGIQADEHGSGGSSGSAVTNEDPDPRKRRGGPWWLLDQLARFNETKNHSPRSVNEFARFLRRKRHGVWGTLRALQDSKLVERKPSGWDVTPTGRTYLRLESALLDWLMVGSDPPSIMPWQLRAWEE